MAKVIGICNLHDDPHLGVLTASRPCGAVSFLGRYGLVDFTLSNFSNSHIDRVYVLVKQGILQMRNHIGSGSIWTRNTRTGFINLLINEDGLFSPKFNTDIANIRLNLPYNRLEFDYAVIAPSFMLTTMDYRPIIEAAEKSGADITVVYSNMCIEDDDYANCDSLILDKENRIIKVDKNPYVGQTADISLESFIIKKDALRKIINEARQVSEIYGIRQMINFFIEKEMMDIRGYEYKGYVVPILSLQHYCKASFSLLNYHEREKLFFEEWPIYTTTHNTPPTLYLEGADVKNSFVANGSVIKGKVTNCIISRDVLIERGAVLKNCIVFSRSVIGNDVNIEYLLVDKEATVDIIKNLNGDEKNILYIKQGAKV